MKVHNLIGKRIPFPFRYSLFCTIEAIWIFVALQIENSGILNAGMTFSELLSAIFTGTFFETIFFLTILYMILKHHMSCTPKVYEMLTYGLVTLSLLVGDCLKQNNSLYPLCHSPLKIILVILTWIGLTILTARIIDMAKIILRKFLQFVNTWNLRKYELKNESLITFCIMFICWFPIMIIRWPAGIEWDAYYQMEQFLGYTTLTAHWPPASSALMGGIVWIGYRLFGSYSIGAFCYVLLQAVTAALVFTYTVKVMKQLGVRKLIRYAVVLMYSVLPIFSNYLTAITKDSIYSVAVVLFVTLLAVELLTDNQVGIRKLLIILTGIALCVLRNNGIYIIYALVLALIVVVIVNKNQRRKYLQLLTAMIVVMFVNLMYSSVLLPRLGIESGSVAEALSIPFQQTARYLKEYPEDVTNEEREIISAVLSYDNLAALYNPDLSDPVKATYTGRDDMLLPYFRVWFKMFLRHPGVYIEATLNNCYPFFYLNMKGLQEAGIYISVQNLDQLQFNVNAQFSEARSKLRGLMMAVSRLPVLSFMNNSGLYFWISIYLLFRCIYEKKGKHLLILLPSLVGILVCIAAPTYYNNGLRYALPIIYVLPFAMTIVIKCSSQEEYAKFETSKLDCG